MRLLAGMLAAAPFPHGARRATSLSVAADGTRRRTAPARWVPTSPRPTGTRRSRWLGGPSVGIVATLPVPTAQVKGAILLAGVAAEGETTVTEPAATRDHTERALAALGAPVSDRRTHGHGEAFPARRVRGTVPGDVSSAAFLVAAAALTGSELTVRERRPESDPPSVPRRDGADGGADRDASITQELGEPVGDRGWRRAPTSGPAIEADELPLVIDEVPVLAGRSHARGDDVVLWRRGAPRQGDRPSAGRGRGSRTLGGLAGVEGDDLVLAGGGLRGGSGPVRRRSPSRDGARGRGARGRRPSGDRGDGGCRGGQFPGLRRDASGRSARPSRSTVTEGGWRSTVRRAAASRRSRGRSRGSSVWPTSTPG